MFLMFGFLQQKDLNKACWKLTSHPSAKPPLFASSHSNPSVVIQSDSVAQLYTMVGISLVGISTANLVGVHSKDTKTNVTHIHELVFYKSFACFGDPFFAF